jgi:group I intron endonuclease
MTHRAPKNEKIFYPMSELTLLPNFSGIYIIRCVVNDCKYVGQASRIKNRLATHAVALKKGKHHSRLMQLDFSRYSIDAFEVYVAVRCDRSALTDNEAYWMKKFQPEYNSQPASRHAEAYIKRGELVGLEDKYIYKEWHRWVYGAGRGKR